MISNDYCIYFHLNQAFSQNSFDLLILHLWNLTRPFFKKCSDLKKRTVLDFGDVLDKNGVTVKGEKGGGW